MSVPVLLVAVCLVSAREQATSQQDDKEEIQRLVGQFNLVDKKQRFAAIDKLSAMGTRVIPYMWKYLADENNQMQVRVSVLQVIEGFGEKGAELLPRLERFLSDKNADLRGHTLLAVGRMKGAAKAVLPQIKKLWRDEDPRVRGLAFYVATNLVDDLNELLPDFGKALSDPSPETKIHLLQTLEQVYGRSALPLLDEILGCLGDENNFVRNFAALCLAAIGKPAVPELIRVVRKKGEQLARLAAVDTLGRMRPAGREQVEALVAAFKERELHDVAVQALVSIGAPSVDPLRRLLEEDAATVTAALATLGAIGEPAGKVWKRIVEIMEGSDAKLRLQAAMALSRIGPGAAAAIDPLRRAAKSGDPKGVRLAAISALGRLGAAVGPALDDFIELLREDDHDVSQKVEEALIVLGAGGVPLVDDLLALLDADSAQTRTAAVRSLIALGEHAVAGLREALSAAGDARRRRLILEAIGGLGAKAGPIVPQVMELLDSGDATIRRDAALSLMRIGGAGIAAASRLSKLLTDRDSAVRLAAVAALGSVARMREDTVAKIVARIKDGNIDVRHAAIEALGWPGNAKAVPSLQRLLDDEDMFTRLRAARSLEQIGRAARPALRALAKRLRVEESQYVRRAINQAIAKLQMTR